MHLWKKTDIGVNVDFTGGLKPNSRRKPHPSSPSMKAMFCFELLHKLTSH